jgi:hypothetical protein
MVSREVVPGPESEFEPRYLFPGGGWDFNQEDVSK